MANNRSAFKRLLSTIPKLDSQGQKVTGENIVDWYNLFEIQYQSEIFIGKELLSRLDSIPQSQEMYDSSFIKIKKIAKLVDLLYEIKYS